MLMYQHIYKSADFSLPWSFGFFHSLLAGFLTDGYLHNLYNDETRIAKSQKYAIAKYVYNKSACKVSIKVLFKEN